MKVILTIFISIINAQSCMLNGFDLSSIHKTNGDYEFVDGTTTYYVNPCGSLNTEYKSDTMHDDMSIISKKENVIQYLAKTNTEKLYDEEDHVEFKYTSTVSCQSGYWDGKIKAYCPDPSKNGETNYTITMVNFDRSACEYKVVLDHPLICEYFEKKTIPIESSSSSESEIVIEEKDSFPIVGVILLGILIIFIIGYFIIGLFINGVILKKKGMEIIPHYNFFKQLPGLLKDGFRLIFCCKKSHSIDEVFNVGSKSHELLAENTNDGTIPDEEFDRLNLDDLPNQYDDMINDNLLDL